MYTPNFKTPSILSVSQLNTYIKSLLENDIKLNTVFLAGEISNFNVNSKSGHAYLTLKDESSVIRSIMFVGNLRYLKFMPANGMKVICRGRVTVYAPTGQYQLNIEDMQPDGIGALTLAYEQLKAKLSQKGLFSVEHKKPLPRFPQTVGVITSPTGAAIQDIRKTLLRRFPCVDIVLCPVLVQGDGAPEQLIRAVKLLDEYNLCDVIIIGRGGGSVEDLWAFNNENLAYAIYDCKIPVISAVGHEINDTICDFVADKRAATPTAAAEIAVPDQNELRAFYRKQFQYVTASVNNLLNNSSLLVSNLRHRLSAVSPKTAINEYELNLKNTSNVVSGKMDEKLNFDLSKIKNTASKLDALNPISVLARGYSIAEKDGKVISSKKQLHSGDKFTLEFSDGKMTATAGE